MALTKVSSGVLNVDDLYGFRNRIINGDMRIDQRNAGASVTPTSGQYITDRWSAFLSATSKFSAQQNAGSVTPPTGFSNYLGFTSLSAYTPGASEIFGFAQCIEAFNMSDLAWGTANAKSLTISFWVQSSLTGQFGGFLKNGGITVGGAFNDYFYPFSYTINAANTWEFKTVTIVAPTAGSWETGNGPGISVAWSLGAGATVTGGSGWSSTFYNQPSGSVNLVATNGATLYITGVQAEVGSVATPFERRPYGTELALCQRYYFKLSALSSTAYFGTGWCESTTRADFLINFPTSMRTNVSALEQSGTASHYRVVDGPSGIACTGVPVFLAGTSATTALVAFDVASGLTIGRGVGASANLTTSAFLAWSAEL